MTLHRHSLLSLILLAAIMATTTEAVSQSAGLPLAIPFLDGIAIDGKPDDWGNGGFRVEMMSHGVLEGITPEDFDPRFRLAWNDEGLVFLVTVRDDIPLEGHEDHTIWQHDNVWISVRPGDDASLESRVDLVPGADPRHPEIFSHVAICPKSLAPEKDFVFGKAAVVSEGGYTLEVLLPWSSLGIVPSDGTELLLTAKVSDIDDPSQTTWSDGASGLFWDKVRLAREPSPPVTVQATGQYEHLQQTIINVYALGELTDKEALVRQRGETLASETLSGEFGKAVAHFRVPAPSMGQAASALTVDVAGQTPATVALPDIGKERAVAFSRADITIPGSWMGAGFVFNGPGFPAAEFESPLEAAILTGSYRIETAYYDAGYNQVTQADKPGRYGAVITITPQAGRVTRRFRTLFCIPEGFKPWLLQTDAMPHFPPVLDMKLDAAAERTRAFKRYMSDIARDALFGEKSGAAVLAGLYESRNFDAQTKAAYDPVHADRQWWVTYKRNFYETAKKYPDAFVCPRPIEGPPATVVREGDPAQAGMTPDGVAYIDQVLSQWAADSDEAFAVCLVRHGAIALHKAYGMRDASPMAVDTMSWMASITKLVSHTSMVMLVDRGLVDMSAAVSDYLPVMKELEGDRPVLMRNLYTHTGGFWGHENDSLHDMEEVVADYARYLGQDMPWQYVGTDHALGGKIIEAITGEALPHFYKDHLLKPLNLTNTVVAGSEGDMRSVPLDMAILGQMLVNRGAYGNMRFIEPETFDDVMPVQDWTSRGLSDHIITHGAASSALFVVDVKNDLVIVMCRNSAGTNYQKYEEQFFEAIAASLTH